MDKFSTSFIADNTADNGDYAGETLDMSMKQDWKDQTVYSVGVEYKATDRLALRGGASFSTNPCLTSISIRSFRPSSRTTTPVDSATA